MRTKNAKLQLGKNMCTIKILLLFLVFSMNLYSQVNMFVPRSKFELFELEERNLDIENPFSYCSVYFPESMLTDLVDINPVFSFETEIASPSEEFGAVVCPTVFDGKLYLKVLIPLGKYKELKKGVFPDLVIGLNENYYSKYINPFKLMQFVSYEDYEGNKLLLLLYIHDRGDIKYSLEELKESQEYFRESRNFRGLEDEEIIEEVVEEE